MSQAKPEGLTSQSDLAVIFHYDINRVKATFSVTILLADVEDEANPHTPVPAEYGVPAQAGPVFNNWITYKGRAANRRQANQMLRAEERRHGMPNGVLKPCDDGPVF